ncbi:MAG: hypothetical protein DI537_21515 [Stutzerimonas stutzeri]|nr:MAG: hypothetical protein DI537_21515 [Stutzerimonas stutzeri]
MKRRTILLFGASLLAGWSATRLAQAETASAGERFGPGTYNSVAAAEELKYIEANIQPLDGGTKRILITGSAAGLGALAAAYLVARGHEVVAHARNEARAEDVRRDIPGISSVVIGDLADLNQTRRLAAEINDLGTFDVIIHNAALYDGIGQDRLKINVLSPYILTSLVNRPKQLIYLSSNAHWGDLALERIVQEGAGVSYDESKAQLTTFAMALSRLWLDVQVNLVHPGWVPTRMGELTGTPSDSLRAGYMTQVWLAEDIDPASHMTGVFLFHQAPYSPVNPVVHDTTAQDDLIEALRQATGVPFPRD